MALMVGHLEHLARSFSPAFSRFVQTFQNFLELDDVLGPWEYHRCHEVEEMIANDGIKSSVGGM